LTALDPSLWLSRSWTTRAPRPGENSDSYVFVTPEVFLERVAADGFFEWAEFLGSYYGTPIPEPPAGSDILLEIDVQGAEQVVERCPDALVVLLVPPSPEVQRARMVARGDRPGQVERRLAKGAEEVERGRRLAVATVVNDEVDRAVAELGRILDGARSARKDP
jgi:guanylate kinase